MRESPARTIEAMTSIQIPRRVSREGSRGSSHANGAAPTKSLTSRQITESRTEASRKADVDDFFQGSTTDRPRQIVSKQVPWLFVSIASLHGHRRMLAWCIFRAKSVSWLVRWNPDQGRPYVEIQAKYHVKGTSQSKSPV